MHTSTLYGQYVHLNPAPRIRGPFGDLNSSFPRLAWECRPRRSASSGSQPESTALARTQYPAERRRSRSWMAASQRDAANRTAPTGPSSGINLLFAGLPGVRSWCGSGNCPPRPEPLHRLEHSSRSETGSSSSVLIPPNVAVSHKTLPDASWNTGKDRHGTIRLVKSLKRGTTSVTSTVWSSRPSRTAARHAGAILRLSMLESPIVFFHPDHSRFPEER